ncbi:unnamed protein product [Pedinophyceae sp. YPF-701]|nr:unnamed protein product [Pedinophyceae sp. YPF-701]
MVLGAIIGAALGVAGGWMLSEKIVKAEPTPRMKELFDELDFANEPKSGVQDVVISDVHDKALKRFLAMAPLWTRFPDFQRTGWVNTILERLWPHYAVAIRTQLLEMLPDILEQQVGKIDFIEAIAIEELDLGKRAPRLGGMKVYESNEDELVMETPLMWGSGIHVRAAATIRAGKVSIYAPVEVSHLMINSLVRITFSPLAETIPCLGAVHVSLLEQPYIDFDVKILGNTDVMSLPFVGYLARQAIEGVLQEMVVYPNSHSSDILPNGGREEPAHGMLHVVVRRGKDLKRGINLGALKQDPYVSMWTRKDRRTRTTTKQNDSNPVWDEEFYILVHNKEEDVLTLRICDDDFGAGHDDVLGELRVPLTTGDGLKCVQAPGQWFTLTVEATKGKGNVTVDIKYIPFKQKKKTEDKDAVTKGGRTVVSTKEMESGKYDPKDVRDVGEDSLAPEDAAALKKVAKNRMAQIGAVLKWGAQHGGVRDMQRTKGVLTVKLHSAIALDDATGGCDPYVVLSLVDPNRPRPMQQQSKVIMNDREPRFDETFEFVAVSALSQLKLEVWDKTTGSERAKNLLKLKLKSSGKDVFMGRCTIPVKDVSRNGRIKDDFPLQEVQSGRVVVTLTWTEVRVDLERYEKDSLAHPSDETLKRVAEASLT